MNCKQGDVAVIVRSVAGNEGKVVRCLELHPTPYAAQDGAGPRWVTDPPIIGCAGWIDAVLDANMRPLRGQEGEDEVLRLAGRPVGTPQAA